MDFWFSKVPPDDGKGRRLAQFSRQSNQKKKKNRNRNRKKKNTHSIDSLLIKKEI